MFSEVNWSEPSTVFDHQTPANVVFASSIVPARVISSFLSSSEGLKEDI
jgi:hypothetical protein